MLGRQPYLCGDVLTAADIALFTTLLRFEPVYHYHFKCNLRRLRDHPHLRRATVATPDGHVEIVAPPVIGPDRPFRPGAVPAVGQHTEAIRAEFLG